MCVECSFRADIHPFLCIYIRSGVHRFRSRGDNVGTLSFHNVERNDDRRRDLMYHDIIRKCDGDGALWPSGIFTIIQYSRQCRLKESRIVQVQSLI